MKKTIIVIGLSLILLVLLGCSTQTKSDKMLGSDSGNISNQQPVLDRIQVAELNSISVDRHDTVLLKLSNAINIERQVEVKLLSPEEPIWNGDLKEFDWAFGAYKFEVSLHDIKPTIKLKKMFSDPIVTGSAGPVHIAKGAFSPDDAIILIYIGIGQDKRNATVKDVGNNQIVIRID